MRANKLQSKGAVEARKYNIFTLSKRYAKDQISARKAWGGLDKRYLNLNNYGSK